MSRRESLPERAQGAFGPKSFLVARHIVQSEAPSLVHLLDEISNAFPNLAFSDFHGGFVLADMLIRYPGQLRAAEGIPPPDGDPVGWLDKVIAILSPTRGSA